MFFSVNQLGSIAPSYGPNILACGPNILDGGVLVPPAAKRQSLEHIYSLVRSAVVSKRPIAAIYHGRRRLLCPHRLGRNRNGELRVLCYQYGGESESGLKPAGSPDNWRCIVLEKLSSVELLEDTWRTAPNHSRPGPCVVEADVDAEDPHE
jgi:hypothetical protein